MSNTEPRTAKNVAVQTIIRDSIDPKQIWAFDEPGPYGGNAHITMTEEQIVKHMRSRPEYANRQTDAYLLDQFIVINWATKEDREEELDYANQPHPNW